MSRIEKYIGWLHPIRPDDRWVKLSLGEAQEIQTFLIEIGSELIKLEDAALKFAEAYTNARKPLG